MSEPIDHIGLSDVIELGIEDGNARLWVNLIARVVTFDLSTQKATVQPVREDPARPGFKLPEIVNIPLRSEKSDEAARGALWIPVAPGEIVTVEFLTHPIDQWLQCATDDDDIAERKRGRWRADYSSAYFSRGISRFCKPLPASAVHATSPVLSGNPVLLGDSTATDDVALAPPNDSNWTALQAWFNSPTNAAAFLLAGITVPPIFGGPPSGGAYSLTDPKATPAAKVKAL